MQLSHSLSAAGIGNQEARRSMTGNINGRNYCSKKRGFYYKNLLFKFAAYNFLYN